MSSATGDIAPLRAWWLVRQGFVTQMPNLGSSHIKHEIEVDMPVVRVRLPLRQRGVKFPSSLGRAFDINLLHILFRVLLTLIGLLSLLFTFPAVSVESRLLKSD